jgi:hypothetical protein
VDIELFLLKWSGGGGLRLLFNASYDQNKLPLDTTARQLRE